METPTPPPIPEGPANPRGETPPSTPPSNRNFWIAFIALMAPGLLALLGNDVAGSVAAFLIAPAAGLVAGISLGRRFGRTTKEKIGASLLLVPLSFIAAEVVAAVGCDLGGFTMRFQ